MNPGPWGVLIIAVVVLLLFGRGKIGSLMGEVAGGIKAFRKGMAEDDRTPEEQRAAEIADARAREATVVPPAAPAPTTTTTTYADAREPERRDA